jgi:hypothetical protein
LNFYRFAKRPIFGQALIIDPLRRLHVLILPGRLSAGESNNPSPKRGGKRDLGGRIPAASIDY